MSDISVILEERGKTHGQFAHQAMVGQMIKKAMRNGRNFTYETLSEDQIEAMDMIASKLARICCGDANHIDNWLDIEGYSRLIANRLEKDAA